MILFPATSSPGTRRGKNNETVNLMPTIFRAGPYRFLFYASDRDEPHHIHGERNDKVAKYWLDPIRLQNSGGFNRLELKEIRSISEENQESLMEAWYEYFGR